MIRKRIIKSDNLEWISFRDGFRLFSTMSHPPSNTEHLDARGEGTSKYLFYVSLDNFQSLSILKINIKLCLFLFDSLCNVHFIVPLKDINKARGVRLVPPFIIYKHNKCISIDI